MIKLFVAFTDYSQTKQAVSQCNLFFAESL